MSNNQTNNSKMMRRKPTGGVPSVEDLCEAILEAPVYDREDPPSGASLVAAYVALTELAQDLAERVMGCGDARDAMEAPASGEEWA